MPSAKAPSTPSPKHASLNSFCTRKTTVSLSSPKKARAASSTSSPGRRLSSPKASLDLQCRLSILSLPSAAPFPPRRALSLPVACSKPHPPSVSQPLLIGALLRRDFSTYTRACWFWDTQLAYMATVSVSLSASSKASAPAAMSSKRAPLASNPNVANSPLRAPSILTGYAKTKRSFATVQREEPYGQPPPVKKQILENGAQRAVRSPTKPVARAPTHIVVPRNPSAVPRPVVRERSVRSATTTSTARASQAVDTEKELWKKHHRAKFPKMVFYFESIPDDVRAKLTKRVTYLGAVCHLLST